jgi:VanZ family protein
MWMILTNYYQVKLIKNLSEHKNIFLWCAVIWTLIVTFFCLVSFDKLPSVKVSFSDKLGHLVFHFGITFLWFLYYKFQRNNTTQKALKNAFLFSLFYGITIEFCQAFFTTTRKGDILDVFANMSGATFAVISLLLLTKLVNKNVQIK